MGRSWDRSPPRGYELRDGVGDPRGTVAARAWVRIGDSDIHSVEHMRPWSEQIRRNLNRHCKCPVSLERRGYRPCGGASSLVMT